jgi:lipid II:glycine glycyltransferase (peptidoglycan interpeptide bridge formation enzyme)
MLEHRQYLFLDPSDECWTAFVTSNPRANIFHHPAWINLLAECYGYRPFVVVVRDASGRISAGLPVMEVNSPLTGRRWVSLPFSDYCAPLCRDDNSLDQLTRELTCLSQESNAPRFEVRWELPVYPGIQSYCHYVLHTLKLDSDAERVRGRLHRMHRQNIGTAEKRGVRIERGEGLEHLQIFYRLQLQTRHRHGMPVQPWRYFKLLGSALFKRGLGFALLAYKDDQCLAAAVVLAWQQTLTAKYAASRADSLSLRPNDLLFWTAIHWGCENGYSLFDMGRTDLSNTGLREFKDRWGAEQVPLTYSILSAMPPQPTSGRLMSVMHAVIRHSPLWVCSAMGELLYGHFG